MSDERTTIDQLCVNTIRTLAMDAVQQAKSGHPGTPMAMAPVIYTLWQRFLRFDPDDPIWPNRDRFVLSMGHASMLLYAMLHLTGVRAVNPEYERLGEPPVTLEDIRKFRQLDSKCPGHPEYRWTSGVETTTGPMGQGVATSVGMAIGARWMASHFNRPGYEMFGFDVYALAGDGCMMEGVASEAASLAGHLRLANLCWVYDNNKITIDIMKQRHEPVALVLSRQALPTLSRTTSAPASGVERGAYVLADAPGGKPDVILMASGSEIHLCLEAHVQLVAEGVKARVVSMPSWELFEQQSPEYKDEVLPPTILARVAVEQASTFGWERYVGRTGHIVGMRTFGASAPLKELQKKFGFAPARIVAAAKAQLGTTAEQ